MRALGRPSCGRARGVPSVRRVPGETSSANAQPTQLVSPFACPVCGRDLTRGRDLWHRRCQVCGYESADLLSRINAAESQRTLLWEEAGLRDLRAQNFRTLLKKIEPRVPAGGRLLDVGCAHGWFLDLAAQRYQVLGIEPERAVFEATRSLGLPVRRGFFPEILVAGEEFDVIVFNDVFEHVRNVHQVLEACRQHLPPGGVLVLNLPNSGGTLYRIAKLLRGLGIKGPFERLWQKDLPSPHLHYFDHRNLRLLVERSGFQIRESGRLETLHGSGLYDRVSHAGSYRRPQRGLLTVALLCLVPVLRFLSGDIMYVIAIKR
jgi:2-polyprenyl-3-methyl-5-hydroxy-6-metoxy-1,4-benzoquinol methylase